MVLRRLDATSFGVDILVLLSDDLIAFLRGSVGLSTEVEFHIVHVAVDYHRLADQTYSSVCLPEQPA
ncbi:hypothetical protein FBUS_07189 [Fasciolopsis buskii]|uniref:Uncharacterized protein n=1 Tax=Fasciolopsis buskii TaxID=27845 RepID=A0A8E0RPT0_9TREM|nr:hypothetical protein FBUS_07189 [Fasciolopsis buski]